jgi:hypothetical protein
LSSAASTAGKDQAISNVLGAGCSWSSYTSPYPSSSYPYPANSGYGYPKINQVCHEIKAIVAFSFLTWILSRSFQLCALSYSSNPCLYLVMFYTVTLIVLALRARSRGHNVWQTAVRDGILFSPSEKVVGGAPQVVASQPAVYQSYPPLAQQSPHPLAQQYNSPPAQQYNSLPAQQYISPLAQQYIPAMAQQYNPGGRSPPAQRSSVSYAYPA